MSPADATTERSTRATRVPVSPGMGYLIGPAFLLLAAWFYWGPLGINLPSYGPRVIDPQLLSTAPRRQILGDPPVMRINVYDRTCMDCHRVFPPRDDPPRQLLQHRHIVLDHGINDRCRNCHFLEDRDRLVLHGGEVIGFGRVVELCAKCHGPTYRDWQNGAHGRTNGFWDQTKGPIRRLGCTECHDPHQPRVPALDPVAPLPGPRVPERGRVGSQNHSKVPERMRNPLHPRQGENKEAHAK